METYLKQLNYHQSFSRFSNLHLLFKLATRFLAPVFFFSVILSYSSMHPFMPNFMPLVSSFNIDKNYMFLLCNGILVLIAKISGIKIGISHQETTSLYGGHSIKSSTAGSPQKKVVQAPESEMKPALVAEEGGSREVPQESLVVVGEGENAHMVTQDNLEGKQRDEVAIIDEDHQVAAAEEEDEEVTGLLSAEELNKKCDDFIRKMREGIKFEAQQVVMVQY